MPEDASQEDEDDDLIGPLPVRGRTRHWVGLYLATAGAPEALDDADQ